MKKYIIALVVIVLIAVLGFLYYRQLPQELENPVVDEPAGDVAGDEAIVVTHSYDGTQHHYSGSVTVPTPCHSLFTQIAAAKSFPEQISIELTTVSPPPETACIQVLDQKTFDVSVTASEGARLVGITLDGESVSFEVFEESKG